MAKLASDWLRYFRLLFCNRSLGFHETCWESRSKHPLPSWCFSGRSEKQDGCPDHWLAETFLSSSRQPLNLIQRHMTEAKSQCLSTKFVISGPIIYQHLFHSTLSYSGPRLGPVGPLVYLFQLQGTWWSIKWLPPRDFDRKRHLVRFTWEVSMDKVGVLHILQTGRSVT